MTWKELTDGKLIARQCFRCCGCDIPFLQGYVTEFVGTESCYSSDENVMQGSAESLNAVKPSGHFTSIYRQFNIQQFYVLPTQCIYVFCVDLRTNSDYFPMQH